MATWVLTPLLALAALGAQPPLTTVAERSGWTTTGRYAEVLELCAAFERAYAGLVKCTDFGVSPEGRKLAALIVDRDGEFDPAKARARNKPVLVVQGGIHAGEI